MYQGKCITEEDVERNIQNPDIQDVDIANFEDCVFVYQGKCITEEDVERNIQNPDIQDVDIANFEDCVFVYQGKCITEEDADANQDDFISGPGGDFYDSSLDEHKRIQNARREARSDFTALSPIPGVTDEAAAKDPSKFFNGMFMFGISIAAFLAVLMIAIGGIQYMSTDAVSGKTEGRERITYAIMGLLLVLFSWILLRQINPEILNFNFLDNTPTTTTTNSSNTGTSGGGTGGESDTNGAIGLPVDTVNKIKVLEDIIANGGISEAQKDLARQKIIELKNQ